MAVTNSEVARIFEEIAEILELHGQDRFRVIAYQKAARTILQLEEPLTEVRARGELLEIPGVGESIAAKVEEILDTGHLKKHDELMKEFPPGVIAMMRIPGVGPRTAETLYKQLGISSVDELEQAAIEGRIRQLRGFKEKTEENILQNIRRMHERGQKRIPLARAYPLARQIMTTLKNSAPVDRIEAAGSLRRMREDVGDIDILITSNNPAAVMEAVTHLPMVMDVQAAGSTKSTVQTDVGIQVDFRVVEPETFGAALQYFTGSKDHNVKLRTLAAKKGFKLSEYGIFKSDTDERIGGKEEEEMYAPLGVRMFPPELREDRGEIEMGKVGVLPRFVQLEDLRGDLHVHSKWSDGRASIRDMALAAREYGLEYVAICDHSVGRGIARGLTIERVRDQILEIRSIQEELEGISILAGTEVDIRADGTLDFPDELLAELDICIASIHTAFGLTEEEQTERFIKVMRNPYVDIIGHPTGREIGTRDPIKLDMPRILKAATEYGVIMEINSWPDRLDLNDLNIMAARDAGVRLVIDSDSHAPEHYEHLKFGVATARRGWASPQDVLNTLPLNELLSKLPRNTLRKAA